MPLAAEAWGAGDISASHLRYLDRARNDRTAEACWLLLADPDGAIRRRIRLARGVFSPICAAPGRDPVGEMLNLPGLV